jgi:hypothetical protein
VRVRRTLQFLRSWAGVGRQFLEIGPTPFLILVTVAAVGCGKKGPPLAPLQRIPLAPLELAITRIDNDVYARFKVPTVNIDGAGPANIARVELYAITADHRPDVKDPEALRKLSTLVGSETVRKPLPPLPPPKEGQPPPPLPLPGPGVDQGAVVMMHETLTAEVHTPVDLGKVEPKPRVPEPGAVDATELAGPLVAPIEAASPQRLYYAVAVTSGGRYGPASAFVPAPLGPTSSAPSEPTLTVEEKSVTIKWTAPPDAHRVSEPGDPSLLPYRTLTAAPSPTTYDVYEVSRNSTSESPAPVEAPTAVTPGPVGPTEFTQSNITLGTERCFVVRPVDILNGLHVRGPASPMACASFEDTFPPGPPGRLDAVATPGTISLIWEASGAADLAGYHVLRGEAGSATLTDLTTEAVIATSYRDDSVKPGVRYIYAVIAVDKAGNRSAESNRVEETARQ